MTDPALSFSTNTRHMEGTVVLRLVRPLTISTMFDFQAEFRGLVPPVLILDLSGRPYMDSAGLRLLLNKYVSAENGKRVFLLSGVSGRIRALMELTRVDQVLMIFPTVEQAEASLTKLQPRPATEVRPAR